MAAGARDDRALRVRARLLDAIAREGPVPFDRFVEIALYDPSDGYYAQADLRMGRSGDFYTAAHASPLFGATLARRVLSEYDRLERPDAFRLIEVGAGDGTLLIDIARALRRARRTEPLLRAAIVEGAGPRRDRLVERLGAEAGLSVDPYGSLAEVGPFEGIVLANELLDALPFRRLVGRGAGWRELVVAADGDRLGWAETELARPVPAPALPTAEEGTVLEIGEASEGWIRELADHLVRGSAVLLDYGREEGELLRAHAGGTLAAVAGHRPLADPLGSPGLADLSAFVNWTRLRAVATRAGLQVLADRPQAEALGAWGFQDALQEARSEAPDDEARVRLQLGAKRLLFGFEGFRALELGPGPPT